MEFVGRALPLSQQGFRAAASLLGVGAAEIWSVLKVEARGFGFLSDKRPVILFERHLFSRLTDRKFDASAPDISAGTFGGYGADGAPQYDRLARAMILDRNAALQSASWGLGQVLGSNFQLAGHTSAEAYVTAMLEGEDQQLLATCTFIKKRGLDGPLREHDWEEFARGYNGPAFKKHKYDQRLAQEFGGFSVATPDLRSREAQAYLQYLGIATGTVDGVLGKKTRAALSHFQTSAGLPADGELDDATLAALRSKALA